MTNSAQTAFPSLPPGFRRGALPSPRKALTDFGGWTAGGGRVGYSFTETAMLGVETVFAAVKFLSYRIAAFPLKVHNADKSHASDYWLNRLLEYPNRDMTGTDLRVSVAQNALLYGKAYVRIVRNGTGRPVQLWPIPASQVTKREVDDKIVYTAPSRGQGMVEISDYNMLEFRYGVILDGMTAQGPRTGLNTVLDLARTIDSYRASYYGNGGKPLVFLESPGKVSDAQPFLDQIARAIAGETARPVLLNGGIKASVHQLGNSETQDQRNAVDVAICRAFGVPPHLLFIEGSTLGSTVEQQNLAFVQHTLDPICTMLEKTLGALIDTPDQGKLYVKHNMDALLRGDALSRAAAIASGIQNGMLTPNEGRGLLDLAPYEGGDYHLSPANMIKSGDGLSGVPGSQTTAMGGKNRIPSLPVLEGIQNRLFADARPELPDRLMEFTVGGSAVERKAKHEKFKGLLAPKASANEFLLYDAIGDREMFGEIPASRVVEWLNGRAGQDVTIRLNSPGGDVWTANAIYNALVRHSLGGGKVSITIDGVAASAATIVAMAGDTISMAANADFMIHQAWTFAYGNASDFTKLAGELESMDGKILDVYSARTGQTAETLRPMLEAETWLSAERAKELGFVDEITPNKTKPTEETKDETEAKAARLARFNAHLKKAGLPPLAIN